MIPKSIKSQYLNCGILVFSKFNVLFFSFLLIFFNVNSQSIDKGTRYAVYQDYDFKKHPEELTTKNFSLSEGIIPNPGWGKFKAWVILKPESLKGKKYLLIQNPVFDEIKIYKDSSKINTIKPGTLFSDREVSFRFPTFNIENIGQKEIYISGITSLNPAKFPIRLFDEAGLTAFRENQALLNGLIFGFIAILVLLNLIIFGVFKLRPFGVFAISAALFATLYFFLEGYFFGKSYSAFFFENNYLNFHYLIYFGFQLSNYRIFSSVFQLEITKNERLFTIFRILFLVGIIEGIIMLFSPLWYGYIDNLAVKTIGMTIRIGAMLMNIVMLLILLKIGKENKLARWFLLAMIPGWLVYLAPRFLSFLFNDFWFTMPQLYSVSMVWYIAVVSFGLATEVYKNLQFDDSGAKESENKKTLKSDILSKRETEILLAFTNGFSYTDISDAMFISPHTVRTHLKNIYSKIGVNSKAEAVRWVLGEEK